MGISKISAQLSKIISKEITQIAIPKQALTPKESTISVPNKEDEVKSIKDNKLVKGLPVEIKGYIPVIIKFIDSNSMNASEVKELLTKLEISNKFDIIPAISAKLSVEQINQLAKLSQVEIIEFDDYMFAALDTARKWFGVDDAVKEYGLTGSEGNPHVFNKTDNVIAILDTGIDINHVDLGSGKVIGWKDFVNPAITVPYDDNGHGTHVASIAAGLGKAIWDYRGVAYGSALVGVKVLNAAGSGTFSQLIAGIAWCILNKDTYGIKVINMSLGGGSSLIVRAAVAVAVAAGIVVVCAAGNSGPALGTIGSPGDSVAAITVGNMADVGQGGYFLVDSSSRGPTTSGNIKPDLVAPGFNITAAKAGTTNQYATLTGTSMSSPFVAGVVALMLDANNNLTPTQVKELLTTTADPWDGSNPNNDYGNGRLRAFDVIKKLCHLPGSKCKTHHKDCHSNGERNHKRKDDNSCERYQSCCSNNYNYCCCDCWDNCCNNGCWNNCWNQNNCCISDCKDSCEKKEHRPELVKQPEHFKASGTIASPQRSDWYEFYVTELGYPVGVTLILNSVVPPSDGDIEIFDSNYGYITGSFSTQRQDTASFVPIYLGKYLIQVYRYSDEAISYSLDVSAFGKDFRLFEKTDY